MGGYGYMVQFGSGLHGGKSGEFGGSRKGDAADSAMERCMSRKRYMRFSWRY